MKKILVLLMMSGAISLTACGNNVEVKETETTQKHEIIENMETEEIKVEALQVETVQSSDDDFDDESVKIKN